MAVQRITKKRIIKFDTENPNFKPPPEPEDIVRDVNPKVRQAKSKKAKGEYSQGTGSLRIPLNPQIGGQAAPGADTGGLNV